METVHQVRLRITGDRRELRTKLVQRFLEEEPGTGTGDLCSRYIYLADRAPSGHHIELHRPAFRNNGMDFTVRCPTIKFNPGNRLVRHMPRHGDLVDAFRSFRRKYGSEYPAIQEAIESVYKCNKLPNLKRFSLFVSAPLSGGDRCPADVALLATKWLFVEQDVTYWNNSGRRMFYEELQAQQLI